ncbi:multicopy suppressor of BFA (Brefeldin A) [Neodidymelliopsis sp. IMI 364377]|nr:multicopy suppressor of BFA (Brefeldin A) [Neodidymelliopsis sp. IMI 364377]
MAELATPSAAQVATADATAPQEKQQNVRPEKPDEDKYKEDLAKAEKEHQAAQDKLNAAKAKLDTARPNNKDSPNAKRQQELKTELNAIRQTQQGNKSGRNAIFEKMKKLDEQLKSRQNELKTNKSRVNFRSAEDVDQEIARLQKQVDSGMMKLVDEKKALSEISSLHKARKNFSGFDSQQKGIDDIKAQIAEQKKLLDDPEQKALSEKYTVLQTELDGLKAEQDEAFKNLKALREQTDKARAEQQEKYLARKELKDTYYQQKRAFQEYDFQARKARNERRKQEQVQYLAGKRKEAASKRLEEASAPAYQDEIIATEGLIRHFDPSALPAKETATSSKFAASAQRTVDDSAIKGTRISKKDTEEESYFMGTGGKKGKKGKKAPAPAAAKFNLNMGVIEELAKVGVDAPSSQAEVSATVEKLKEKLAHWKGDQERKTKENVEKAQKEIERLEAEEDAGANGTTDAARKPAQKNQAVNGSASPSAELAQEKDAAADVTEDLKKASIEDKEATEA